MPKTLLIATCLFFSTLLSKAQAYLNLDFEGVAYDAQPRKWMIEGEGEYYAAHLDSNVALSGKRSLYLSTRNGSIYTYLSVPGELVKGRVMEFRGNINFSKADSIQAFIGFRDPAEGRSDIVPINLKPGNWTNTSHTKKIDSNYTSDRLLIAVVISGTGSGYIDNFELLIDGKPFGNDVFQLPVISKKDIALLHQHAIKLQQNSTADRKILDLIGSSTVVALGENSHGSATIYKQKLKLVQLLVQKGGFEIFALESPHDEAEKVNEYVQGHGGTLDSIIKYLVYPAWQTKEIADIIEWIKLYNNTSRNKIQFRGFSTTDRAGTDSHDKKMADIIQTMIKQHPEQKIILSGDNSHITKSSGKMGYYLSQNLGNRYLAIGFTFKEGMYSAYGPEKYYKVHQPYPGTYEYFLSKSGYKNYIVDLRLKQTPVALSSPAAFRAIGSRPQDFTQFQEIELKGHFDAIIYLEKSEATNFLK